jgi:hypothetical protein
MACRGVHFALSNEQLTKLLDARGDEALLDVLEVEIEEQWDEEWSYETDKAWDAIHRCLTNGEIGFDNGEYPLDHCILGGRQLHSGEDYIVSLKAPQQVSDIGAALQPISRGELRRRYFSMSAPDYSSGISEEDFEYTWDWFNGLGEFFAKAASAGRHVIFTVDQ